MQVSKKRVLGGVSVVRVRVFCVTKVCQILRARTRVQSMPDLWAIESPLVGGACMLSAHLLQRLPVAAMLR